MLPATTPAVPQPEQPTAVQGGFLAEKPTPVQGGIRAAQPIAVQGGFWAEQPTAVQGDVRAEQPPAVQGGVRAEQPTAVQGGFQADPSHSTVERACCALSPSGHPPCSAASLTSEGGENMAQHSRRPPTAPRGLDGGKSETCWLDAVVGGGDPVVNPNTALDFKAHILRLSSLFTPTTPTRNIEGQLVQQPESLPSSRRTSASLGSAQAGVWSSQGVPAHIGREVKAYIGSEAKARGDAPEVGAAPTTLNRGMGGHYQTRMSGPPGSPEGLSDLQIPHAWRMGCAGLVPPSSSVDNQLPYSRFQLHEPMHMLGLNMGQHVVGSINGSSHPGMSPFSTVSEGLNPGPFRGTGCALSPGPFRTGSTPPPGPFRTGSTPRPGPFRTGRRSLPALQTQALLGHSPNLRPASLKRGCSEGYAPCGGAGGSTGSHAPFVGVKSQTKGYHGSSASSGSELPQRVSEGYKQARRTRAEGAAGPPPLVHQRKRSYAEGEEVDARMLRNPQRARLEEVSLANLHIARRLIQERLPSHAQSTIAGTVDDLLKALCVPGGSPAPQTPHRTTVESLFGGPVV